MISIVSLRCMASGNDSISTASLPETMTLHACMEYAIEYSTKNEIQNLDNADTRIDRREAIPKHSPRPFRQEHTPTVISDVPLTRKQILTPTPLPSITDTR